MRSLAQLNLPNPIRPECSPPVLQIGARNNDKSLCFQLDPTFGNDEVGISIIPCGTSLINSLGQIDDALTCSLEPARVIWYGASGRCAYVERQALGQSRSVTGIGSRHTVHLMLFRPLSCLHGSPPSFGLDKGSSFGWGLLHVGFNVGFIWPCTTRREFVV